MSPDKDKKAAPQTHDRFSVINPEVKTAEDFYNRLNPQDAETVRAIVGAMESLVTDTYHLEPSDSAFLAVYGTGGTVTKLGDRPDIDLLIATNCVWEGGFLSERHGLAINFDDEIARSRDWVAGTVRETVEKLGYNVEVIGELPYGYDEGVGDKGLLRLIPQDLTNGRKPIDVIYARFFVEYSDDFDAGHKKTLGEFKEEDVDYQTGASLPRVALFESEFEVRDFMGNLPSERGWHW